MKQLHTPERYYTAKVAQQLADDLQSGDDEWTYTVVTSPSTGWSWIVVTDEDGAIVAERI